MPRSNNEMTPFAREMWRLFVLAVKRRCEQLDVTLSAASKASGHHPTWLNALMKRNGQVTFAMIVEVAKALEMPLGAFFNETVPKTIPKWVAQSPRACNPRIDHTIDPSD